MKCEYCGLYWQSEICPQCPPSGDRENKSEHGSEEDSRAAPGSANCLPPADVIVGPYPYTTTHQVWINNQLICGTDMEYLADIVRRALNHWRLTDEGKEWWSERQKADNSPNGGTHVSLPEEKQ